MNDEDERYLDVKHLAYARRKRVIELEDTVKALREENRALRKTVVCLREALKWFFEDEDREGEVINA